MDNTPIGQCENLPLTKQELATLPRLRSQLVNQLGTPAVQPFEPPAVFSIVFGLRLDAYLHRKVTSLYLRAALKQQQSGFVYVFRDTRDPTSMVKIGSTRSSVDRRLTQWRRELGGNKASIVLLYAYPTRAALFAEGVLHTLLTCQWVPHRINRLTNHQLIEYFRVADTEQLRLLCRSVLRHVDWYVQRHQTLLV